MSTPFVVGEKVLVDLNSLVNNPTPHWVEATITHVNTTFADPIYITDCGIFALSAIKERKYEWLP